MSSERKVKTELSVRKAIEFDIKYPDNKNLSDTEKNLIKNAINKGGVAIKRSTFIDSSNLPKLLSTDKAGAQIILNNAPKADVKQYGNRDYLSTPHIQKEIALRKEQPRCELDREKLTYASECLDAFSNNLQLNKERNIENDRIVKERHKIGARVIKKRGSTVSEISGELLNGDACVHHKNRIADKPEEAFDDSNLIVMKNEEHRDYHNSNYTQDSQGFDDYVTNKRSKSKY